MTLEKELTINSKHFTEKPHHPKSGLWTPNVFQSSVAYAEKILTNEDGKPRGVTGAYMNSTNGYNIAIYPAELNNGEIGIPVEVYHTLKALHENLPCSELAWIGTESYCNTRSDDTIHYLSQSTIANEEIDPPIQYGHYWFHKNQMYKISRQAFDKQFNKHIDYYCCNFYDPKTHVGFEGEKGNNVLPQGNRDRCEPYPETEDQIKARAYFTGTLINYQNTGTSRLSDLDQILMKNGFFIINEIKHISKQGEIWIPISQYALYKELAEQLPCVVNFVGVNDYKQRNYNDVVYSAEFSKIRTGEIPIVDLSDHIVLHKKNMREESKSRFDFRNSNVLDNPPKNEIQQKLNKLLRLPPSEYHEIK